MKFDRLMEQLVGVFALLVLAGGALLVVAPFVTALLWGGILAYCTWRPVERLTVLCGGRRGIATLLVVLLILCALIVPIFYASVAFSTRVPALVAAAQGQLAAGIPPLPDWLSSLPVVGQRLQDAWNGVASHNPEVVARLRELSRPALMLALGAGLAVLRGLGLLLLSVLFAAVFYLAGDAAGTGLRAGMRRVAGSRADYLLGLIGATVKGVVFGILGTSLAQAVLIAIGLAVAGVPSPGVLGLLIFFLAIIPAGPMLVVIPAAVWLAQHDATTWAVILVVWTVVVGVAIDNVLKPILIGKSSKIPFILVMIGVLGGAAAFGMLGVFVGPTLLAVANAVVRDWIKVEAAPERAAETQAGAAGPAGEHGRPATNLMRRMT